MNGVHIPKNYWFVWPIGIAIWLLIGWVDFGYFEWHALKDNDPNEPTLSFFVYTVSSKYPLAMAWGCILFGAFWGSLLTHFYWHWCPPGSVSEG